MYNELYAAWVREIESAELSPLSSDFYVKVFDYVRRIKEETRMLDKKTLKAELLEYEMRNAKHIARELTRIRYRKLKKMVGENQKIASDVLTAEEEKLCTGLASPTQAYISFSKNLIQGQAAKVETEPMDQPRRRVTLRFIKPIPAIIGSDMKTYGPFAVEDVASLPIENARILVKQGLAVTIDVS